MTEKDEEKKKKKKEYYDHTTRIDEVSPARRNLLNNFANRDSNDMLRYYLSRVGRIEAYQDKAKGLDKIKERLDELMEDKETSLLHSKRLAPDIFFEYYKLIDSVGELFDEYGFLKDKYDESSKVDLSQIQKIYDYDTVHNLIDDLFIPGHDGIMYGAKGDGKSNYALNLAMEAIKQNYIVATNIGVLADHPYPWISESIIKVTWMNELLKLVAKNKIKNMTYIKKGLRLKIKNVICIIDEGEQFMTSISRKTDSSTADYSKFSQLSRKLSLSFCWIFHRFMDVPKTFRESPNLTYKIMKGIDYEGNKLERPKEKAIIEFVGQDYEVFIDGIPKNDILDTDATSGFDIYDKKRLDKSVDIDEIFRICKDVDTDKVPHAILKYLDDIKLENQPIENLYHISRGIFDEVKIKIHNCKNKTEFYTIAKICFQDKYKIPDISLNKPAEKSLKSVINDEWELFQISTREEKIKGSISTQPDKINPRYSDFELIKMWISKYNTSMIKAIVEFNYREMSEKEVLELYNYGISKNKLIELYGHPCKAFVFSLGARNSNSSDLSNNVNKS